MRSTSRLVCFGLTLLGFAGIASADLLPRAELEKLGARRYWDGKLQLRPNEMVSRISLLDENLYVLTDQNRVFAVHALTGVLRWSRPLAEPNQTVRGPTHSPDYVLFSTPGDVRVIDRATGESKGEPRSIRGVIIDVQHDDAEINVGQLHGLYGGETLQVHRGDGIRPDSIPLATLKITQVMPRYSKGKLVLTEQARHVQVGDRVRADLVLPLKAVRLPFAPSSAAVADDSRLFFGAANARLYSIEILTGFEHWEVRTPRTVTSTPVLVKDNLYYAGQDGLVVSCTKADKIKNWTFQTEGAVFADLEVTPKYVLVASGDRSLYCLDRETGNRVWRERMDMPLSAKPIAADKQVYQEVPDFGLFAMDIETGKIKWHRPEGGRYLMQSNEDTAFFWSGMPGEVGRLVAINPETGKESGVISTMVFSFAAASRADQAMIFVSRLGDLLCARPKSAEPLKPAQLAMVLKDDRAAKVYAKMGVDRKEAAKKRAEDTARIPERPSRLGRYSYLMEDWLRSPRDRMAAEPTSKPADEADRSDEAAATSAPADDEEAAPKDDKPAADEDTAKKDDEKPAASSDDDDDGGDMKNDKDEGGSSDDDDDDKGGG